MADIQTILRFFGITRCYRGYLHASYAIYLAVTENECLEAVTKEIYMETADYFGCKWTAVERNLRTIAARAWQVDPALLRKMAGYKLTAQPTASEFIEIISNYILRQPQADLRPFVLLETH